MGLQLSRRLSALVDAVRPGEPVWDIGCDHGQVGLEAVARGRASEAILVDESSSAIRRLRASIERHANREQRGLYRVICADARRLAPEPVAGTVILAGMGRKTAVDILEAFVLPNASPRLRLVLQPEVEPDLLLTYLKGLAGATVDVDEVKERGRSHPVFIVDTGAPLT